MAIKARKSTRTVPLSKPADNASSEKSIPEPIRQHLHALLHALRDIESIVIVAAGALRDENEFIGVNVARMLRIHVSNRLSVEIDRATEQFSIQLKPFMEEEPWAP